MSGRRTAARVEPKVEALITNNPKRKRQLVSTACLSCQTKHRACGIERPCFQCVRFGVECYEGEERKKIRKKRTSKKAKAEKEEPPSPSSSPSPSQSPEEYTPSCHASDSTSAPPSPPTSPTIPHTPVGYHPHSHGQGTNFHEFTSTTTLPSQPQQTVSLSYVEDLLFNAANAPSFTTDILSSFNTEPLPMAPPPFYANIPPVSSTPISAPPFFQPNPSTLFPTLSNPYLPTSSTQPNFLRSAHRLPHFQPSTSPSLYSQTPQHFVPNTTHSSHAEDVKRLTEEVTMLKQQLDSKSGSDEAITVLKDEVSYLKAQLSEKQPTEMPLLVSSMASGNWRIPDGPLDSSKSLYVKLKLPRSKLKNFGDERLQEEITDMSTLHRRLAHERAPTMSKIGYRTVQCGNGNPVTFMACGLILKFDDNGGFQGSEL